MATLTQAQGLPEAQPTAQPQPAAVRGLKQLMPGEHAVDELLAAGGASFLLTDMRVVYSGAAEEEAVLASARLADITSVELARRPRDRRAVVWAIAGLIAAVGVWQVIANETAGAVAGAAVGLVALGLLADYWFRPGGLVLRFRTAGGAVSGPVEPKTAARAAAFAARAEEIRTAPAVQAPEPTEPPLKPDAPFRAHPPI